MHRLPENHTRMADLPEFGSHPAHPRLPDFSLHDISHLPPENRPIFTASCSPTEGDRSLAGTETQAAPLIDKECSMCGDVGIPEDLFQCTRCRYRYQHIYCSRSYPNLGSEIWICNWCLHEDDKAQEIKQLKQQKLKRKSEELGERRNNAFEFLLQVAQSLPENGSSKEKIQVATSPKESDITSSTPVPKRHRCNPAAEKSRVVALDRWRQIAKNRLQMNPPRGIGRRYKLLADVLC